MFFLKKIFVYHVDYCESRGMKIKNQLLKCILIIILIASCSIFDFDGSKELSAGLWKITVPSLSFGESVDISGDYAIVGSSNDSTGCAYVFERDDSGWPRKCALKHNDDYIGDFGHAIAIEGIHAAIGDYKKQKIYCFSRTDSGGVEESNIDAPDQSAYIGFGYSIDLDNEQLAVGSRLGPVILYEFVAGHWVKKKELEFSNCMIDNKIEVCLSDQLIAISKDRDVNIFLQSDTGLVYTRNLQPFDSTGFTNYKSIAIHDSVVVVGDYSVNDFSGKVFIFELDGDEWQESVIERGWGYNRFGHSVGIYSDYLIVGGVPEKPLYYGDAYIYSNTTSPDLSSLWEEEEYYSKSRDCGWDVAIDENFAIFSGSNCAYIYEYR